jgi:hypothetical protein
MHWWQRFEPRCLAKNRNSKHEIRKSSKDTFLFTSFAFRISNFVPRTRD